MSATATTSAPMYRPPPAATTIGFTNVVRSEWTKLRSVRSTYWTAAVAVIASEGSTLRAVFGGGLYMTAVGLLGYGLGALVRHTAGALSAFFAIMFASTPLVDLLPTNWRNHVINYMPINAGSQILSTQPSHGALSPWHGFLVLCTYGVAATAAALFLVNRRDA